MNDSNPDRDNTAPPPGSARPTLKTISNITGFAVATVSRALHDAPDIGQDTKKRVRETAARIGYFPNRAGVRLRTGKTNVVALVLSTNHDMTNQHAGLLISAVANGLRHSPYHLNVTPHFPGDDKTVPVRYLVETGSADAIILNQIEQDDPGVAYLMDQGFAFATHGRSRWSDRHAYFDFDNARFGQIAIEMLAKRGRKSVLVVAPPRHQNYGRHLVAGARERADALGLELRIMDAATTNSPTSETDAAFIAHYSKHPQMDAVLCASPTTTLSLCAAAEDIGLTVGREFDVVAKEATPLLKKFRKAILTVDEDVSAAGHFLARAVMHRISEPNAGPMQGLDVPHF